MEEYEKGEMDERTREQRTRAPRGFDEIRQEAYRLRACPLDLQTFLTGILSVSFDNASSWADSLLLGKDGITTKEELSEPFPVCGKVWRHGDYAYQCNTCGRHPASAICQKCFEEGDHEGHDYVLIHVTGGMCDCGDEASFDPKGFCKHHKGTGKSIMYESLSGLDRSAIRAVFESFLEFSMKNTKSTDGPKAIDWIETRCSESMALAELFVDIIEPNRKLERIIYSARRSTDQFKASIGRLFLCLLKLERFKFVFGEALARAYPGICRDRLHGLNMDFILTTTVQIFSISNIVEALIRREDLLSIVLDQILLITAECCIHGKFLFISEAKQTTLLSVLSDFENILSVPPGAAAFLCSERGLLWTKWISFLKSFQNSSYVQRIDQDDPDFVTYFAMEIQLHLLHLDLFRLLFEKECLDLVEGGRDGVARRLERIAIEIVEHGLDIGEEAVFDEVAIAAGRGDMKFRLPVFSVLHDKFSFHFPLTRLIGFILSSISYHDKPEVCLRFLRNLEYSDSLSALLDVVLRIHVAIVQAQDAKLWQRDHMGIHEKIRLYQSKYCHDLREIDNFLLHVMLSFDGPEKFITRLISRFGIEGFFAFRETSSPKTPLAHAEYQEREDDHEDKASCMAGSVLVLIGSLLTSPGFSLWDRDNVLRNRLIHQLAIHGSSKASELRSRCWKHVRDVNFNDMLKEVAQRLSSAADGTYQLKEDLWAEVNPFFLHYDSSRRHQAETNAKEQEKTLMKSGTLLPPCGQDHIEQSCSDATRELSRCRSIFQMILASVFKYSIDPKTHDDDLYINALRLLWILTHSVALEIDPIDRENILGKKIVHSKAHSGEWTIFDLEGYPQKTDCISFLLEHVSIRPIEPTNIFSLLFNVIRNASTPTVSRTTTRDVLELLLAYAPALREFLPDDFDSIMSFDMSEAKKMEQRRIKQANSMQKMKEMQERAWAALFPEGMEMDTSSHTTEETSNIPPGFNEDVCAYCKSQISPLGDTSMTGIGQISRDFVCNIIRRAQTPRHLVGKMKTLRSRPIGRLDDFFLSMLQSNETVQFQDYLGAVSSLFLHQLPRDPSETQMISSGETMHVHCCGHVIHSECADSAINAAARSVFRLMEDLPPVRADRHEYLCPVCRRVGNCFIPLYSSWSQTPSDSLSLSGETLTTSDDVMKWKWNGLNRFRADCAKSKEVREKGETEEKEMGKGKGGVTGKSHQFVQHALLVYRISPSADVLPPVEVSHILLFAHLLTSVLDAQVVRNLLNDVDVSHIDPKTVSIARSFIMLSDELGSAVRHTCPASQLLRSLLVEIGDKEHVVPALCQNPVLLLVFMTLTMHENRTMGFAGSFCFSYLTCIVQATMSLNETLCDRVDHATFLAMRDITTDMGKDVFALVTPFLVRAEMFCNVLGLTWENSISLMFARKEVPTVKQMEGPYSHLNPLAFIHNSNLERFFDEQCMIWFRQLHESSPPIWFCTHDLRPSLYPLPEKYSDVLAKYLQCRCERCNQAPIDPLVCLVCGSVVCMTKCHAVRTGEGAWKMHAHHCSDGVCLFLRVKTSQIFAHRRDRTSVLEAPYVDEHGEPDPGLRRGQPLSLDHEKYDHLTKLYFNGELDFDTTIHRQTRL
eukprot:TRINITY_DN7248_c0_g1_i3.p1 TRINITY_DN7248_c0_g1~~TRINITY_DN7248_c0_g1_i3.p1  ORF type:complete len:1650 (-),score=390.22 TRINITY_DN7248_c0_g1_i3:1711-6537(-)